MYDFISTKPVAVMYMSVKEIECLYLYNFTSTKPGAVMYLSVKDIECVYVYDCTSTKARSGHVSRCYGY